MKRKDDPLVNGTYNAENHNDSGGYSKLKLSKNNSHAINNDTDAVATKLQRNEPIQMNSSAIAMAIIALKTSTTTVVHNSQMPNDHFSESTMTTLPSTTISTKSSSIPKQVWRNRAAHRLELLNTVPERLAFLLNSRNETGLEELLTDVLLPNCALRSPSLHKDMESPRCVIQHFVMLMRRYLNYNLTLEPCAEQIDPRVVSRRATSTGIYLNTLPTVSDRYHDVLRFGKKEQFAEQRGIFDDILARNDGSAAHVETKMFMNFILNRERTHVEKYSLAISSLTVKRVQLQYET